MILKAERSVLVLIDVQERLAPAIDGLEPLLDRVELLLRAAGALGVPILVSEQHPRGLGPTLPRLAGLIPPDATVDKLEFSAAANPRFRARLAALDRPQVVVCGMEAHVCVLQTALELAVGGADTALVRDASGSRLPANVEAACRRAAAHGVDVVTAEMVVFEWLGRAGTPAFKQVSPLLK